MEAIVLPLRGTTRRTTAATSGAALSENGDTRRPAEERGADREGRARPLGARIACALGVLFAVGSVLAALVGRNPEISGGTVGVGLGILGYFLGARNLATATVFLGVAAIFFALAASQGLIPGIESFDRDLHG